MLQMLAAIPIGDLARPQIICKFDVKDRCLCRYGASQISFKMLIRLTPRVPL